MFKVLSRFSGLDLKIRLVWTSATKSRDTILVNAKAVMFIWRKNIVILY